MAFYGIWRDPETELVVDFIKEEEVHGEPVTMVRDTEEELRKELEGQILYDAGMVEIIEL